MKSMGDHIQGCGKLPLNPKVVIAAINHLQPEKSQLEEIFATCFSAIRSALERGVTREAVMRELAVVGFKLHPTGFKKLYEAEKKKQAAVAAPEKEAP